MRKQLALAGVCVVGLVAPTTVGAATKSYNGTFEPGGTLSFKVKNTNNGKKVKAFTFVGFPVQCNSGPETTSGNLSFAPKVKDKKFEADAILGNPSNPQARLTLLGKLKGGGEAEGTMKVKGSKVPIDPSGSGNCSSPKTDWTASVDNRRQSSISELPTFGDSDVMR